LGAEAISLYPGAVLFGERPTPVMMRIAERCRRLCEHAETVGVEVLYENVGHFARSKPMWELVEMTEHELCGVCWNAARAAVHGERPAVSLNTLNFRIRLLELQDGELVKDELKQKPIGEGEMRMERLLQIAAGIGFEGFLSLVWDRQAEPDLAEADETMAAAIKTITEWMRPKLDKKGNPLTNREAKYLEVDPEEEKRKKAEKAAKAKAKAEAAAKAKAEAAEK
jgi:sugar phosphate isomerase/epimerase